MGQRLSREPPYSLHTCKGKSQCTNSYYRWHENLLLVHQNGQVEQESRAANYVRLVGNPNGLGENL